MGTNARPAPLPLTDLEAELLFYRSRWARLSAAIGRLLNTARSAPDDRLAENTVVAAESGFRFATPGINGWSAGP